MFLFVGHNAFSTPTEVASWGAARLGVAFNSRAADDWRDRGGGSQGARGPRGGFEELEGSLSKDGDEEGVQQGGDHQQQ
jgi:hypothetical protein